MKIRKTIQGSIPSNKVYNSYNEDKHNVYSTEYLNDKLVHVGPDAPQDNENLWIQKGKNLFDITKVSFSNGATVDLKNETITVTTYYNPADQTLKEIAPDLVAGETYVLNIIKEGAPYIYLNGSSSVWPIGTSHVITQAELDGTVFFYGYDHEVNKGIPLTMSNISIEKGKKITRNILLKNKNNVYETFTNNDKLERYHTTEQIVGTWINDKPIYRKVVILDEVASNTVTTHAVDLHDMETLIDVRGTFIQNNNLGEASTGVFMPLSVNWRVDDNLYDAGIHTITKDSFSIFMGPGMWVPRNVIVIFEYTKTTD